MPPSGRTSLLSNAGRCIRRAKSNLFFSQFITRYLISGSVSASCLTEPIVDCVFSLRSLRRRRTSQHTVNVNECCITRGGRPQGEPTLERLRDGNIHMCFFSRSGYRPFITPPPSMGILLLDITLCSISFRCRFFVNFMVRVRVYGYSSGSSSGSVT